MSGAGAKASATQHTAVDPTEAEEEVMKGRITFALTAHKEVRYSSVVEVEQCRLPALVSVESIGTHTGIY